MNFKSVNLIKNCNLNVNFNSNKIQFPINIHLGSKEISTHLVTEIAGIFIGFRYYLFLKKRKEDTISKQNRLIIFAAVCFGSLIGSRLVGILENPSDLANSPNKFVYIFSNKTILGGLLGGLFCVEFIKKKIGVTTSSGDLMTYPILLGLIIGRIGCFCEGLSDRTVGSETQLFSGINFGDGINRHPLALYELFFLVIVWIVINQFDVKNRLTNGSKFKLFLISYLFFRFLIEFLKENKFTIGGLSTLQITALIGLLYYFKTLCNIMLLFHKHA